MHRLTLYLSPHVTYVVHDVLLLLCWDGDGNGVMVAIMKCTLPLRPWRATTVVLNGKIFKPRLPYSRTVTARITGSSPAFTAAAIASTVLNEAASPSAIFANTQ